MLNDAAEQQYSLLLLEINPVFRVFTGVQRNMDGKKVGPMAVMHSRSLQLSFVDNRNYFSR